MVVAFQRVNGTGVVPGRQFTGKATRLQTLPGGFSLSGGLGPLSIAYGNGASLDIGAHEATNDGAYSLAWSTRPEVAALGGLRRLRTGVLARSDKIPQPVWQPPAVGGGSHVWATGCGRIHWLHRNDDAREGGNYPSAAAHRALNSLRGVNTRQCSVFYQSLTPPAGLGLLALSSRRVLPGRAARGSVVPRKMACRLARGAFHGDCGSRPSTRARCPFQLGAEMDAKTTRGLVLLAALSLSSAGLAWAVDHAVFTSVFAALGAVAVLGAAAPRPRR
jgi:hypothetical protein